MTATLSADELLQLRIRAQWLHADVPELAVSRQAGGGAEKIADVARHMLALQGQDWRSSRWALGVRAPGTTLEDVHDAFNDRLIVRSWPMRGTIHVVPAEDIGWMQAATNRRVLAGAPRRREFLGISDAVLGRLVDVATVALTGGGTLNRDELSALWTEADIDWKPNWRYHLVWWLCQNGIAVLGPIAGGEPRLALAAEWIRTPKRLEGDEALTELALRYTRARGPIQAKDLAWWSGLTMREARSGLALAEEAGTLERVEVLDRSGDSRGEHWCAPELMGDRLGANPRQRENTAPESSGHTPTEPEWLMLPAFDEHLLGYADRSAQLDAEHFERIVPGRNGMFLATIVHRGQTVGTWKRGGTKTLPTIDITPLPGRDVDLDGVSSQVTRWQNFHDPSGRQHRVQWSHG